MSDPLNFTVSETARGKRGQYTITVDVHGFRLWLDGHLQGQFTTTERARVVADAIEAVKIQTDQPKDGLPPCPFCGGEATVREYPATRIAGKPNGDSQFGVDCTNCGIETGKYMSDGPAIADWKTRSPAHAGMESLLKEGLEFWNDEDGDNLGEWRTKVRKILGIEE